jgi:serine protease Do
MRILESNFRGLLALTLGVGIVGAAVVMAQKDQVSSQPVAVDARALSSVFREISKQVLPSIVSIETEGKITKLTSGSGQLEKKLGKNHPLEELFKNNPEFRGLFEGRGRGRQMPIPRGKGSGFIIDAAGIVITNSHVVNNAEKVIIRMFDGREFLATDVKADPRADIAILRFDAPSDTKAIRLGDSDAMQIGDWVMAVGSPFGLDLTVTQGIISAKGRGPNINERENFIQTDAAVNPGNSGGPLLNLNGEVIGINTAISTRSGGYDGVSFAIPVNMAKWISKQLIEEGNVKRAYLGVAIQSIDSRMAKQYGFKTTKGAIVTSIFPGSPADNAGLEIGDLILELDGKKISTTRGLQAVVERLTPETSYDAKIIRNGEEMTLPITVGVMPGSFTRARISRQMLDEKKESPAGSYKELGIETQEPNEELLSRLGFEDPSSVKGVVITQVEPGSLAHSTGLRKGLIIEGIGSVKNMKKIETQKDFEEAVKGLSVKDGFSIQVRTPRGRQFIGISSN